MFKLVLEKAEQEIKLPTSTVSSKKQEFPKNLYFCFTDYTNTFDCVDQSNPWKILKKMRTPDHLTCLLSNLYAGLEQQLELDLEQQTVSILGKEYTKAVYCHHAYLTYMQSTSGEMPGWMKHCLETRLPGEITATSDMEMTPLMAECTKEPKNLLMKLKKLAYNLTFRKVRS